MRFLTVLINVPTDTDRYHFFESNTDIFTCKARHKTYYQKVLKRHKKFYWTNFNKIRRILLDQDEFGTNCAETSTPKYRWKFLYRPIFKRSNIGR